MPNNAHDSTSLEKRVCLAYIYARAIIIAIVTPILVVTLHTGFIDNRIFLIHISVLLIEYFTTYIAYRLFKKEKYSLIHFLFIIDIVVLMNAVYLTGGLLNVWNFLPVFIILFAGSMFSISIGTIYAVFASVLLVSYFSLEYTRMIPHFDVYNADLFYWMHFSWCIDALVGFVVLYLGCAIISGRLGKILKDFARECRESLDTSNTIRKDLEASRTALIKSSELLKQEKETLGT